MAINKLNLKYRFKDKFLNIVLEDYKDKINYALDNLYIKTETDAFFSGRSIATTSPLQGGGTLGATRTLSIKGLSTLGANNQVIGAQDDYRDGWEYKTLTSTANQVTVTHAVGTVTFSTPQDIATTSNVTFGTIGSGKLTVDSGAGQSIIIKGTSTGDTNVGWIGFYDSDGTTRRGHIGDGSSGDDDIYIGADTGYLRLIAAGYISLGTHTYFPDDVVMSFGASLDYSIGYTQATDTLQIVDGTVLGSNIRLKLDSSGHFDFGAGNLTTTGTLGSGAFTLTQNSDTLALSHDGSNAYVKWSDGDLGLMTDEGTNTNTFVSILGKGTGVGVLEVYDTDDDSYIILGWKGDDQPTITTDATPTEFNLLHDRPVDIKCWSSITGNPYFYIYGYKTAVGVKYLRQRVETDGDALIEAENNLNIIAGGGSISFGNENLVTTGTLNVATNTLSVGEVTSNVGIGTASPSLPLQVNRNFATDNTTVRDVMSVVRTYSGGVGADGIGAKISFRGETDSEGAISDIAKISAIMTDSTNTNEDGALAFETTMGGASNQERMRILADGKVGFMTTTPGNNVEIFTDASGEGILIKSTGDTRNLLAFDSNRAGAGANLSHIEFNWNSTLVARIICLSGADTGNKDEGLLTFETTSGGTGAERMRIDKDGNIGIGATTFGTNAVAVFAQATGTAPTTSPADAFQVYSADQAAGNACLHTRTEGGAVVKLYQQAHITDAPGDTAANNATTINAILVALENNGLLASA